MKFPKAYTFISVICQIYQIFNAIDIFKNNVHLKLCTRSQHPCPEELNLKMISFFKKFKCNVGYSGHELCYQKVTM